MEKTGLNRNMVWLFVVVLLVGTLVVYNIYRGERPYLIVLSSGSPGGVYYPLGGAMAEVISNHVEGVRCDSESTSGSVENIRLVGNRESDLGMVTENAAYKGVRGEDPFARPYPVQALFSMYSAPLHIITVQGSGIDSIQDLAGKRVSIDAPGSGTEEMARTLLQELDLLDQLRTFNYSQQEAATALRDGTVDAVFWNFAYPGSVVMEVSATRRLHFIPLEAPEIERIVEKYPYFMGDIIPAGIYDHQEEDIGVITVNNLLVVRADMDQELAYQMTRALFENRQRLVEVHDIARRITLETARNTSIEIHPGALQYFMEMAD